MIYTKSIYRKIRYPLNDFLFSIGAEKYLLKNQAAQRIMAYHGVDKVGSKAYNSRFISEDLFEQQVIYFKKNFHIVSLKDYYQGHFPDDKLSITLTFDDGYANNFTRILPILEKHQVPATFFITSIREKRYAYLWTDFYDLLKYSVEKVTFKGEIFIKNKHKNFVSCNTGEPLNNQLRKLPFHEIESFMKETSLKTNFKIEHFTTDYHLQMSVEEIKLMAQSPLATIGSHSHTHADLVQRPIEESIEEMRFSKEWLENITSKVVDAIAFPYGNYNLELVDAAKQLGYSYLLPVEYNQASDSQIFELKKRFGNNPFISLKNQIWCILNEKYL